MRLFAVCLAFALLVPVAARAHPHVWVDTRVTALLEAGQVRALREEWSFDEDFSVMALSEVRKAAKGMTVARPIQAGEVDQLKARAFSNLAHYAYFNHLWAAGKAVPVPATVSEFDARLDGPKLIYVFTLTLAQPVDARAFRVGIWDESYYVDVGPAAHGPAASVEGAGAEGCQARIIDDRDHPIYDGSIIPKVADFTCREKS